MTKPPTGTITFVFTDIEGSSQLWETYPESMKQALARHDNLLRQLFEEHNGFIFKTVGDAFCVAFPTAPEAFAASVAAQKALQAEPWGEAVIRVRMALHTGTAEERDGDYFGPTVNRVARLMSVGHGGQTLLSLATHELVRDQLPDGVTLLDMGKHRLRDLVRPEHIFQVVTPDLPQEFPPLKAMDFRPHNLPVQRSALIGREKELEGLQALLLRSDIGLVTLTGPGGVGKTRLSLQVGAELLDQFEDGVYFVALAAVQHIDLVVSTIAQTLDVAEEGGRPLLETLLDGLKEKEILLILDNFEQIIPAAPVVADLLSHCPHIKVLVTSREVLHLRGEHEFALSPLTLPDLEHLPLYDRLSHYASVALFIERSVEIKPDFAITNDNAPAVAEICHRLDGLPLAIELAAARINILTPHMILARLEPRLPFLIGGARDLPLRQRTLRGAIEWSYDLLNEGEQKLFARLSIFVGGCTLAAAEVVAGGVAPELPILVMDGVSSLVDKSLMHTAVSVPEVAEPRYLMLETIREYALGQLAKNKEEARALRQLHAAYFLELTEAAEPQLLGPQQIDWLNRLDSEHDNIRAVLDWTFAEGEVETAVRLCGAIWRFWYIRGFFSEGRHWLQLALARRDDLSDDKRDKLMYGAGGLAYAQADFQEAAALFEERLTIQRKIGDESSLASALNGLGVVLIDLAEFERAAALLEEGLTIMRKLGDDRQIASVLNNLGRAALQQEQYEQSLPYLEESLSLSRKLKDKNTTAITLINCGRIALYQGDYEWAVAYLDESVALQKELGDKQGAAFALAWLGQVALVTGDLARAKDLVEECMALERELGVDRWLVWRLNHLGLVARFQGESERAMNYFKKGLPLAQNDGEQNLGVWILYNMGSTALDQQAFTMAVKYFQESLALALRLDMTRCLLFILASTAVIKAEEGQLENAVTLLAAADALLKTETSPVEPIYQEEFDRNLATIRSKLDEKQFKLAWEKGQQLNLNQAIEIAGL